MEGARVIIEVQAGVILGHPEPEHSRRWAITTSEWERCASDDLRMCLLAERNGAAQGYAALLMLNMGSFNWVRTDWLWL